MNAYSRLIVQESLSDEELAELLWAARQLWEQQVIKDKSKLFSLRKRGRQQIPGHEQLEALEQVLNAFGDA